jgi:uncharacterized protein YbcI
MDGAKAGAERRWWRLMESTGPCSTPDSHWEEAAVSAISREVVRTHARHFGSNPKSAEVSWQEDFLVCLLEGALTETEVLLIGRGGFDRVQADRRALHDVLEPTYKTLVETLTGYAVCAYMSEVDPQGLAVEAFILAR